MNYAYKKIIQRYFSAHHVSISVTNVSYLLSFISTHHMHIHYCITIRNDITVTFQDENQKELGRDYFVSPQNQCTVSGYGNIKTITPRGGSRVFINASADLCGRHSGDVVEVSASATSGQVTDCFWRIIEWWFDLVWCWWCDSTSMCLIGGRHSRWFNLWRITSLADLHTL